MPTQSSDHQGTSAAAFFAALLLVLSLSSCTEMTFINGNTEKETVSSADESYHIGFLFLVELSEPVALKERCEKGKWVSVKDRLSFKDIVVGYFDLGIYNPRTLSIVCESTQ